MPSEQLQTIIEMLRSRPQLADLSIEEQRASYEEFASQLPLAEDVRCEPVEAGGVPAEWIATPGASDERVIHYLHGGGGVPVPLGGPRRHRRIDNR